MPWLRKISQIMGNQVPDIMYHATYRKNVASILTRGLIPRYTCIWDDCEYGIYLASDPDVAE